MANKASKTARRANLDKQLGRKPLGDPTANNIRRLLKGEETISVIRGKKSQGGLEESEQQEEIIGQDCPTWESFKQTLDLGVDK